MKAPPLLVCLTTWLVPPLALKSVVPAGKVRVLLPAADGTARVSDPLNDPSRTGVPVKMVDDALRLIAPLAPVPILIGAVLLEVSVMLSMEPDDVDAMVTPPPDAALLMLTPVTLDAVEASMVKAGLVAPLAPTVSAVADEDVTTVAPAPKVPGKITDEGSESVTAPVEPEAVI